MRFHGLNPVILVLAFILAFGALVAGNFIIHRAQVTGPLERFLRGEPAVKSYRIESVGPGFGRGGGVILHVTLARVDDLKKAYTDLEAGVKRISGERPVLIDLSDKRDKELCDLYYRVHFSVFEAIETGSFERMARVIESEARAFGCTDARAFVDLERVYIALYKGDHYLYEIVGRGPQGPYPAVPARAAPGGLW